MRVLLKVLAVVVVSAIATRVAGVLAARQSDEGSEVSDEFNRTVVMDSLDFRSQARGLRHGRVSVLLGAARLDLRDAVLDHRGARLTIDCTLGGLAVIVPSEWAVTVDETLVGGGETRIDVSDPDDLPEDAPRLTIDLLTRLAGCQVSTRDVDP